MTDIKAGLTQRHQIGGQLCGDPPLAPRLGVDSHQLASLRYLEDAVYLDDLLHPLKGVLDLELDARNHGPVVILEHVRDEPRRLRPPADVLTDHVRAYLGLE